MELKNRMNRLVKFVEDTCVRYPNLDHHDICSTVASNFQLWDNESCFPIWLSRVVQGVMEDMGVAK